MQVGGVWTAPAHFLGDYPAVKWRHYADALPSDMRGKSVLDIGCNGGFFLSGDEATRLPIGLLALTATTGISPKRALRPKWKGWTSSSVACRCTMWGALAERFDIVLFLGVFYHLRHPLLALDLVHAHAARDLLVFQSMQRGGDDILEVAADYPWAETALFEEPGFPRLHFVEKAYAHDPTNWWGAEPGGCGGACFAVPASKILSRPEKRKLTSAVGLQRDDTAFGPVYPAMGGVSSMIEAADDLERAQ